MARALTVALLLLFTAPGMGHAQRASRDLISRYEAIAAEVEASTLNRALPLFGDAFWSFPRVQVTGTGPGELDPDDGSTPGIASKIANESLRRNLPALERYAKTLCRRLTPQQIAFLQEYGQARYTALTTEFETRRARMTGPLGAPLDGFQPASVNFTVDACGTVTSATATSVNVSRDVLLATLLSAMFVDSQLYIIPDRTLKEMQERVRGARGQADPARAGPVLARIRATPVWKYFVRARRQLEGDVAKPLDRYEEEDIFAALEARRPDCARDGVRCRLIFATAYSFMSANKFDLLFREQVDYVVGHEIGHHALGHVALPHGGCAVERTIEQNADNFGVALTRPDDGLFAPVAMQAATAALSEFVETRFASGPDLFMVQSHQIAALRDGNGCEYPTFQQRQTTARAFEERSYPRTRAQMARFASRSVAGQWGGVFFENNVMIRVIAVFQDTPTGGFTGLITERSELGEFTATVAGRAEPGGRLAFEKTYDGKNGRQYGVAHVGHLLGPNTMAGQWQMVDGRKGSFSFEKGKMPPP